MTEPLRPPPEFAHLRWHFVNDGYEDQVWGWDQARGVWVRPGSNLVYPKEFWTEMRYIAPAVPLPEADEVMVEAVAKALNSLAYAPHEESWAKDEWPRFFPVARAAIAAMRERMTNGR